MKVVLFCGGLGTRIREYADTIPKPMIPIGNKPILWHLMSYYSAYGHRDFVLCLGHKANVIKDYFLKLRPQDYGDCIVNVGQQGVEMLSSPESDWRVALIDTGVRRSIGERLWSIRHYIDDDVFMANYSDSLTDLNLDEMVERFKASGKIACFLAVHPPLTYHFAHIDDADRVRAFRTANSCDLWINGGFFLFRREVFDYMREGEELVLEPFERLIEQDQLLAYKYEGFWQSMDTLKDQQIFETMSEGGVTPWRVEKPLANGNTLQIASA